MITDLNKNIGQTGYMGLDLTTGGGITYNHLNLPERIRVDNKGEIVYTYDATGAKLQKLVKDDNASVPYNGTTYTTGISTTTYYIGGFIYESKHYSDPALISLNYDYKLQFLGHEEGRIRPSWTGNVMVLDLFNYDYFIKDHLGNVRMVLTDERKVDKYPTATFEDAKIQAEQNFYSINTSQVVDATSVSGLTTYVNDNGIGDNPEDATFQAANSQKLYKINSATTAKTGLGITLRVMNGDRIDIFGKSYYFQNNTGGSNANTSPTTLEILEGLLGTPTGGITNQHGAVDAGQLDGLPGVAAGILSMLSTQTNDNNQYTNKPKAYINYIFFDEQFKVVSTGFSPVGANSTLKDHHSELQNILAPKNGYVYIYCSNESPVNVYFDNLQVVHTRGALLEETHYYPFGLPMAGISSKASTFGEPGNKFKYNGKEEQRQEFTDGSGLDWMDYGARMYDGQLGRWSVVDPLSEQYRKWSAYNYGMDNPLRFIDPDGMGAGDFVDDQGKVIGNDGIKDGKVYVIKTTETEFDSKVPADGITTDQKNETKKFLKANSGKTEAFKANDIAYRNSVEIEGSSETRQAMVDVVNTDNGKGGEKPINNREYGGDISNTGAVTPASPGPVALPSAVSENHIDIPNGPSSKTSFHSHASGTVVENTRSNNAMSNGAVSTYTYNQAPSYGPGKDVNSSNPSVTRYVFARGEGKVYIYNARSGVQAILPQKNFVKLK